MIGAAIFVVIFVLFTILSIIFTIPPGTIIYDWAGLQVQDHYIYIVGIINGIIYGFIFWLIYNLISLTTNRSKIRQVSVAAPKLAFETEEKIEEPAPSQFEQEVEEIEGITLSYAGKLKDANIKTIDDLLKAGSTRRGRREIARKTGASNKTVLRWIHQADLFRVMGVGKEYSNLLEKAGVSTIIQLARRNPNNLHKKLIQINMTRRLVRQIPSSDTVQEWIQQAKNLERIVEY